MVVYFRAAVREVARQPREGLISALLTAEIEGDRLSEEEVIANTIVTMVGGQETTTNLIGNGMLSLLRHRDQLEKLREDLSLIPSAVEELLRYESPSQHTASLAPEDVELGGKNIRKRQEQETEQRVQYANSTLIKALLQVIDNFERALAVDPARTDSASILKGLQIVHECMYGSGYGYVAELIGGGRTNVTELHNQRNPLFGGISPEPIRPNIDSALTVMKVGGQDLCICTDGDADRVGHGHDHRERRQVGERQCHDQRHQRQRGAHSRRGQRQERPGDHPAHEIGRQHVYGAGWNKAHRRADQGCSSTSKGRNP